jgi:hypothetical protein
MSFTAKYADALRDIFPGTVVMYGAHERHLLVQASLARAGEPAHRIL